jgi:hypothetical protein
MNNVYFNTLCICIASTPALVVFSLAPNQVGGAIGVLVFFVALAFCNKTLRGV